MFYIIIIIIMLILYFDIMLSSSSRPETERPAVLPHDMTVIHWLLKYIVLFFVD